MNRRSFLKLLGGGITTAFTVSVVGFNKTVNFIKRQSIDEYEEDDFIAFIHSDLEQDLKNLILNDEAVESGKIKGIRFIESEKV